MSKMYLMDLHPLQSIKLSFESLADLEINIVTKRN